MKSSLPFNRKPNRNVYLIKGHKLSTGLVNDYTMTNPGTTVWQEDK